MIQVDAKMMNSMSKLELLPLMFPNKHYQDYTDDRAV